MEIKCIILIIKSHTNPNRARYPVLLKSLMRARLEVSTSKTWRQGKFISQIIWIKFGSMQINFSDYLVFGFGVWGSFGGKILCLLSFNFKITKFSFCKVSIRILGIFVLISSKYCSLKICLVF